MIPDKLGQSSQGFDALEIFLLQVNTPLMTPLVTLPLNKPEEWEKLDTCVGDDDRINCDGTDDNVIRVETALQPATQYRLRFRAYDYDTELGTLSGIGIDNIAVTDGIIIGVSPALPGDYNEDGVVNAADYTVWRDHIGAPAGTLPNDANGGPIGPAQYDTWKENYGSTASTSAMNVVPEPTTGFVLSIALLCLFAKRSGKIANC